MDIINIDSRFRDNPDTTTSSRFTFTLPTPIQNVTSIGMTSYEVPNISHILSTNNATVFQIRRSIAGNTAWTHVPWVTVQIPYGRYEITELLGYIQVHAGHAVGLLQAFVCASTEHDGATTFRVNTLSPEWTNQFSAFDINLSPVDLNSITLPTNATYETETRIYSEIINAWLEVQPKGSLLLRDILGFQDCLLYGLLQYTSETRYNLSSVPYILLQVNDYDTINHYTDKNEIKCFAKIQLKHETMPSAYTFSPSILYTKKFIQPETVSKLFIRTLLPSGEEIDFLGSNVSFTFRIESMHTVPESQQVKTHIQTKKRSRLRNIRFNP